MSEHLEHNDHQDGPQFRLAGGEEGIGKLANDFYDIMETLPEARKIFFMHPTDLTESRAKLAAFLCGYLDGPDRYAEKYGPIKLGAAHAHLVIGRKEKAAWLLCMEKALEKQDWPDAFKAFILKRLETPASRCQNRP